MKWLNWDGFWSNFHINWTYVNYDELIYDVPKIHITYSIVSFSEVAQRGLLITRGLYLFIYDFSKTLCLLLWLLLWMAYVVFRDIVSQPIHYLILLKYSVFLRKKWMQLSNDILQIYNKHSIWLGTNLITWKNIVLWMKVGMTIKKMLYNIKRHYFYSPMKSKIVLKDINSPRTLNIPVSENPPLEVF